MVMYLRCYRSGEGRVGFKIIKKEHSLTTWKPFTQSHIG